MTSLNESQDVERSEGDELDLFALWQTIVVDKWTVLVSSLVCFLLAVIIAFFMTPKYEAELVLSTADDGKAGSLGGVLAGQLGGLADVAGMSVGGKGGDKEAAFAYLKSRKFIESFIEDKHLLPVLFAKKWDGEAKKWKEPEKAPTLWQGYKVFDKMWTVESDKKTGLIKAKLLWRDRLQVVEWANELVKRANDDWRERNMEETEKSLEYLQDELRKTSMVEVQQSIYRVMETQVKSLMFAKVREQYAFKVVDPAAVVDENGYVQPKRLLISMVGLLGGLFVGVLLVFGKKAFKARRGTAGI